VQQRVEAPEHLSIIRVLAQLDHQLPLRLWQDSEAALARFSELGVGAVLGTADPVFFPIRNHLLALVARATIPAINSDRVFTEAGGPS